MNLPIHFLWPEALWLALGAPMLAAVFYLRRPIRVPGTPMPKATRWQRHLPPALFFAALAIAALAAARPTALLTLPSHERTIILAIDVSLSMRAADVLPSRLAAAQAAAKDFVKDQPSDVRLGIVSFAGTAAVVQQPTHDRDLLVEAIDRLQLDRHTAIGSGIIVSLAALYPNEGIDVESFGKRAMRREAGQESKPPVPPGSNTNSAIILLTDGRRTIGPDPVQAARMAADRGVRVYTVGFGSVQGAPIQIEGYSIYMMYDEETLKAIAGLTNAEYFHAQTGAELKKIYDGLSAKFVLQRSQTEVTAFFAAAAAAFLIAAAGLSLAWFGRIL